VALLDSEGVWVRVRVRVDVWLKGRVPLGPVALRVVAVSEGVGVGDGLGVPESGEKEPDRDKVDLEGDSGVKVGL